MEIAIVGRPEGTDRQALLSMVRDGYQPFQVAALGAPNVQPASVPVLQDRCLVGGQPAAHVYRAFACQAPVTELEELQRISETT